MVGQFRIGIAAFGAEIDDKEGHTIAHTLVTAVGVFAAIARRDEEAIGEGDIGVGNNMVSFVDGAINQADATNPSPLDQNFVHGSV